MGYKESKEWVWTDEIKIMVEPLKNRTLSCTRTVTGTSGLEKRKSTDPYFPLSTPVIS